MTLVSPPGDILTRGNVIVLIARMYLPGPIVYCLSCQVNFPCEIECRAMIIIKIKVRRGFHCAHFRSLRNGLEASIHD